MRIPWVSRLAYDVMEQRAFRAERVCETLTERLLSLKMTGAVEVPKVAHPSQYAIDGGFDLPRGPMVIQAPDELRELIDIKAGTDLRRRKMMLRQLAADRAAGIDSDTIREAIENGVASDGVPG